MKKFKELYSDWAEATGELNDVVEIKKHPNFREIRKYLKENKEEKEKITSFLIRELSDEDYRCLNTIILLRILARKDVVPLNFRNNLNLSSDFWIHWYEDLILKEDFDNLIG